MELAKGGEVFDKLLEFGSLTEPEAARLLSQVLSTTFIYEIPLFLRFFWFTNLSYQNFI